MKEDTNKGQSQDSTSLSFPIAPKKPNPSNNGVNKPKASTAGAGGQAKEAIVSSAGFTDRTLAETLLLAQEMADADLQAKKHQKARHLADKMVVSAEKTLDEVSDFLERMFSSGNLLELAGATQIVTGETVEGDLSNPIEAEVVQ